MIRKALAPRVLAALLGASAGGCAMECPAALLDGTLVADGPATLGLREAGGPVWRVVWPLGVGVRLDGDRLALTDAFGTVLAHEGDRYSLPGGQDARAGDTWGVCGPLAHVAG